MVNKFLEFKRAELLIGNFLGDITFPDNLTVGRDLIVLGSSNVGVDETVEGQLLLDTDLSSTAASPALAFGDGDSGFYEKSDDVLGIAFNGSERWTLSGVALVGPAQTGRVFISGNSSSSTSPIYTFQDDRDTGVGRAAADQLSLIAGGVEGLRITEDTTAQALFADGTAAKPSISFIDDTDTGVRRSAADELSLLTGGSDRVTIDASGNVGIGVTSPDTLLQLTNNNWFSAKDNAGTSYVNMLRTNTSDELEIGSTLNTGPMEFETDSGAITALNMPVSSDSFDGDEMSMTFSIDSNPILKVKASSDGAGGIDEQQIQSYGGIIRNTTTVNAATYDLLASDDILLITYTGTGAVTSLTLPSAQAVAGRTIVIKDAGGNATTNNITIDTEASETIDEAATYTITADYDSVTLVSDGSDWFLI